MRTFWLRSTLSLVIALAAACADDIPEVMTSGSSSSEGDTTNGPGPTTLTTDSTSNVDTTEGVVDSTTTEGPADSTSTGEPGSSSSESSGGPVCGDDVADAGEACDGSDLAGGDCITAGFDAGTLACMADCSALDTSQCFMFSCGNDAIEGAEACDGNDLGGATCVTAGFDEGVLDCMADCSAFDTAGCIMYACGNDLVEGAETCDGSDLAGSNCVAEGFDEGTLACQPDCAAYDTSGCIVCNDGVAEGSEVCDGNDLLGNDCTSIGMGFDAGTLACAPDCGDFDTSACTTCGDGVAAGVEECDGADLLGNACTDLGFDGGVLACDAGCGFDTAACTTCGDGAIEGAEQCDGANLAGQTCQSQGFDFGALGCTSGCGFFLDNCVNIINETEPNDDGAVAVATNDFSAANANGPYSTDTLIAAAINPVGDDDIFAVFNPGPTYAILSLETYGPIPGTCDLPTDTVIELRTNLNQLITSNDQGGINNCSLLSNLIIPPGFTVYVRVIDFGDNSVIPAYHLHIRIDPVVCGDGLAGPGEQCDDGNVAPGDGCSATCVAEDAIQEIEPNGTSAQADATGIVATGNALFGGVIGNIGDQDRFRLDLAAPQVIRFETFSAVGVCLNGITTTLRIFNAAGAQLATDTNSGIANCSAIMFPLPAGTYYVQVEETGNNSAIPTYLLEIAVQTDTGVETEPNEDLLSADLNLAGGGSELYVFGDHSMEVDSDYYAIDVPVSGSSIRVEVIEGDRAIETCESNGVDSRVTLYNSAGVQLEDDDDSSRGFCSLIDGTGTVPLDAGAHNLAAGTYYVQVRASTFAQASPAGQFIYRLAVTVREP